MVAEISQWSEMKSSTLNSAYNEVTFNKKLAITKENLCTKYTPFTYKYITLNEKLPIMRQNLCIFFFIIGRVECISSSLTFIFDVTSVNMRSNMFPFW